MTPRRNPKRSIIEPLETRTLLSITPGPFGLELIPFTAPVVQEGKTPALAPACTPGSAGGSSGGDNAAPPTSSAGSINAGAITVTGGVLSLGSGGILSGVGGTLVLSGGGLSLSSIDSSPGSTTFSGNINVINEGVQQGSGVLILQAGTLDSISENGSIIGFDLGSVFPTGIDLMQLNNPSTSTGPAGQITLNVNNSAATNAPQYILSVGTANVSSTLFQLGTVPSGFSLTLAPSGTALLVSVNPLPNASAQ